MEQKAKRVEFRFGKAGKLMPLVAAGAMILWAACSQSNVNGYVLAFFAALMTGVIFAKDEKAYGEASFPHLHPLWLNFHAFFGVSRSRVFG